MNSWKAVQTKQGWLNSCTDKTGLGEQLYSCTYKTGLGEQLYSNAYVLVFQYAACHPSLNFSHTT